MPGDGSGWGGGGGGGGGSEVPGRVDRPTAAAGMVRTRGKLCSPLLFTPLSVDP
jgi:hypothetical protein